MTKVYGYSDDLVVIDPAPYPADEIGCFDSDVYIRFTDKTLIKVSYGKGGKAIWKIVLMEKGSADHKLTVCNDEEAEVYSDVFEIDADYYWHSVKER